MLDLLSTPFMQRALLAALLTGLAAPAIGTFLVQRRLSLMGDGIGHVAVTGVALGLMTGTSPTWTAVLVAIAGAVTIEVVRERGNTNGDLALALLFYGGIAGGVLLTGIADQSPQVLHSYLFGSISTLSADDVLATLLLAAAVLVCCLGLLPQLFAVAQDQEFARVAGLNVRFYNVLVAVLAAVTVTVAMRTVGLLLVSAMMIVPVAAVQQLARGFRVTLLAAMAVGTGAAVGGLVLSAWASQHVRIAPGPTIVLLALACFAMTWPLGALIRRRRRRTEPFDTGPAASPEHLAPEAHPHRHGPDCGHRAIQHGDHVDYVHDGHRHAPHGSHYDEH